LRGAHRAPAFARALGVAAILAGCKSGDALPLGPTTTSPQAAAEPAPLEAKPARGEESGREPRRTLVTADDAGVEPLASEGVAITYEVQLGEASFAARMGDTPAATLEALRRRAHTALVVTASGSRASFSVEGPRFLIPPGLEVRAQGDHAGYALVQGAERRYAEAPEGLWRALLAEGRADVAPLRAIDDREPAPRPQSAAPVAPARRKVTLSAKSVTMTIALAPAPEGARWGATVAQVFTEIAGLAAGAAWVGESEWPEVAELRWANGRALRFVAGPRQARAVEASELLAAPGGFKRERPRLPAPSARAFLGPQDLAQLRGAPAEGPSAEGSTLWLVNRDVSPRVVLLEGVPVGWVAGNQSLALEGLRPGRYAVRWVSPLGELDSGDGVAAAPGVVTLPSP
jgi:hypothetical protein